MPSHIRNLISSTPLGTIAKRVLRTYDDIRHPGGYFTITPKYGNFGQFEMYSPNNGSYQRRSIRGELEPEVSATLSKRITEGCTVWNIGGGWGYYTLALATRDCEVYCFEAAENRAKYIKESVERSGFEDNVTVVHGVVGENVDLLGYPAPDVVLMDIEGWEYEVLRAEKSIFEHHPILIIELHESPEVMTPGDPEISPKGVIDLLESNGFEISMIADRSEQDQYHILAEPPLG